MIIYTANLEVFLMAFHNTPALSLIFHHLPSFYIRCLPDCKCPIASSIKTFFVTYEVDCVCLECASPFCSIVGREALTADRVSLNNRAWAIRKAKSTPVCQFA